MRILFVGDVVGKPGRRAVASLLPRLRRELSADLVVLNGENSAGGFGITLETAQELLRPGVDVITSGNHVWDQKEAEQLVESEIPLLRPLNYPPGVPGRGSLRLGDVLVVNAMGRAFTASGLDCPFRAMDALLDGLEAPRPRAVVVDFHAETTSEKQAMGWYLDGRVGAVVGTHTHVPTADTRILPKGTAFVTDVGMVGPRDSIIGNDPRDVLARMTLGMPRRLRVASGSSVHFNSVLVEMDDATGLAQRIERVDRVVDIHEP
ncbi:MAG: TIGR00282 family metallophosphoesterase [Chloroflexi bacterium]|nr:TIGR00282 family metallophosphoesterase [Chloroflexota bacterium]